MVEQLEELLKLYTTPRVEQHCNCMQAPNPITQENFTSRKTLELYTWSEMAELNMYFHDFGVVFSTRGECF